MFDFNVGSQALSATYPLWREPLLLHALNLTQSTIKLLQFGRRPELKTAIELFSTNNCEIMFEAGRQDPLFKPCVLRLLIAFSKQTLLERYDEMREERFAPLLEKHQFAEIKRLAKLVRGFTFRLKLDATFFNQHDLLQLEHRLMEPLAKIIWSDKVEWQHQEFFELVSYGLHRLKKCSLKYKLYKGVV